MIKMNVIVRLTILTISYGISTIHAQPNPVHAMPGVAMCMYYGYVDRCNKPIVGVNTLPSKCSSFIWDGIYVDATYSIQYSYSTTDGGHLHDLIDHYKHAKPVFLYLEHEIESPWSSVLDNPKFLKFENKSVVLFINYIGVQGIVLKSVFEKGNANLENLSEKLKGYVDYIKCSIPKITFGLEIDAKVLLAQAHLPKLSNTRLDFNILCKVFDFFVITLDDFNKCTVDYLDGIAPVDNKPGNTLTTLASLIKNEGVPKEQLYYAIHLSPQVNNHQGPACSPTYGEKCAKCLNIDPKFSYPIYCSDTSNTLYDKGQFINNNAAGFVGVYVDAIDSGCDCQCSTPFPAFQFILNGYNGDEKLTCTKFDEPYSK